MIGVRSGAAARQQENAAEAEACRSHLGVIEVVKSYIVVQQAILR